MPILTKYSLLPLLARVRAKFQRIHSVPDSAVESIQLAPADKIATLSPISLPGEFDRVRAVIPISTFEIEHKITTSPYLEHGPTIAYRLDDAILADHTLYWRGGYEVARVRKKRAILLGHLDEYHEGQLCSYAPSNIYFGHWLRDAMAMELLAEWRGLKPLSYAGPPWMHEAGYRQMMALPGFPVSFAHIRRLWIVNDLGLNANWISRFKELRERVRRSTKPDGPRRVFLVRGRKGVARELVNELAIADVLSRRGFTTIAPEQLSAHEIADALASAQIVVAVEGSALNHAQFALPSNSGVLVIQPPERFNAFHKILMDFTGIRFGYIVADPIPGGFTVPLDRFLSTLDLVENAI
jgi:hypothetical protein